MDHYLEVAERYLRDEVGPKAQQIDHDPEALREALRGLCEHQLMALRRPKAFGGPALSESMFRAFQETVARYSGSLAFLQTQHQSAGSMISKSDNERLKAAYLPYMADGTKLLGIGFSQLRRAGPPIMTAEPVDGGYRLNGNVPWVTGLSFYPEFVMGAALGDGNAVFGVVPFENSTSGEGTIELSEPMRLAAMESPLTVSAKFSNWFLDAELVLFEKPSSWIRNNDQINITLQGHFALGCARAGLDLLMAAAERKSLPFLSEAWNHLDGELRECQEATTGSMPDGEEATAERLGIRAWAIDLAVRCAHAAVAAHSGAANSLDHPAQRVYREALVYTVSAQTTDIMQATIERISEVRAQSPRSKALRMFE